MIKIVPFNETHIKILCDDYGVEMELSEYFTFYAPNYKYAPKFKAGIWDGKIKLFNIRNKTLYKGLIQNCIDYLKKNNYEFACDVESNVNNLNYDVTKKYVDELDLHGSGKKIDVREYQYEAIHESINKKRSLLLSPTSSGKSAIIYSSMRWHIDQGNNVLIVVPTTMLVNQLFTDFIDYSSSNKWSVENNVTMIYSGKERLFDKPVVISTWQSIVAMDKNDRNKFLELVTKTNTLYFDEAHSYKSSVVLATLEKFTKTKYRIGTTGTIDDSKINGLSLTGIMGPIYKVITTKELMDAKQIVQLKIKCIVLTYPEHLCKAYKGMDYKEEINFLVGNEQRNKFISKLTTTVKGNTLVLFNFVARHGEVLDRMIRSMTDRNVYFIHGGVDADERERIRNIMSIETNSIIIATASLFSTGINIPSIENVIFAIPSKSSIRIRQSIGRGLRLNKGKNLCTLYDISDNLKYKSYTNTTLKHLEARVVIYDKEQFDYDITHLKI